MTIELKQPYVIQQAVSASVVEVVKKIETKDGVSVELSIGEVNNGGIILFVVLWDVTTEPVYDPLWQWEDKDIIERVLEILKQTK